MSAPIMESDEGRALRERLESEIEALRAEIDALKLAIEALARTPSPWPVVVFPPPASPYLVPFAPTPPYAPTLPTITCGGPSATPPAAGVRFA